MRFTAIEKLPDGRERVLCHNLTLTQVKAYSTWYAATTTWVVLFRQETT